MAKKKSGFGLSGQAVFTQPEPTTEEEPTRPKNQTQPKQPKRMVKTVRVLPDIWKKMNIIKNTALIEEGENITLGEIVEEAIADLWVKKGLNKM